jgi:hypothetical protein
MKKTIFIIFILLVLAGTGFFVYSNSKGKGSWKIKAPQTVVNNQGDKENQTDSGNQEDIIVEDKPNIQETKTVDVKIEDKIVAKEDSSSTSAGIINKLVSWGYKTASSRSIDTVVIHSSYNALGGDTYDVDKLIKEYRGYGVSPHYLIGREGKVYQLVADKNIAYHAGVSQTPDGRTNVNDFSIGIEVMNTETGKFTDQQYAALKNLIASLKSKYKIKYVLGHNQIAKGRKTDPWNFDWNKI